MNYQKDFFTEWNYTQQEWDEFVDIEKSNKKEDNIYFGIGILTLGTLGLMFLRQTSFLVGLIFTTPLAILIPFLRMKISYKHLKKGVKNPYVQIYADSLIINDKKIELFAEQKRVKSLKIIEARNDKKLLEFDIQWLTRKGPTNDEFRILIPSDKIKEAKDLVKKL